MSHHIDVHRCTIDFLHQKNGISKVQRFKFTISSAGGDAGAEQEEQEEVRQKQLIIEEFQ